jgi:glutaredoxin
MLFCIFAIQTGSATVFFQDGTNITGDKLIDTMNKSTNLSLIPFPIQFFYNTHCGSCQEAVDYLNGFTSKYPGISVEYHDLYNSSLNNTMYDQYKTEFNNNTDIHYPVIFIGNVGIAGSQDIKLYTEPVSVWYQNNRKSEMGTGLLSWIQNLF